MTAHKETGGPAFPVPTGCGEDQGMTLRDYFAAKAMQAYVLAWNQKNDLVHDTAACVASTICTDAYEIADAMLEARNK